MSVTPTNTTEELTNLLAESSKSATMAVLNTMAYTEVDFIDSSTSEYNCSLNTGDISAIITISNLDRDGLISISLPLQLAKILVSRLVGADENELTKEDYCDGVGELLNMIAGRAKMQLAHHCEEPFRLSLPSIVFGQEHTIGQRKEAQCTRLIFNVEGAQFYLQAYFNSTETV